MATNTTATATNHTGNGSTNSFAISFSFLANNEVDVTVAGVLKTLDTHYTISGSTVTFTSGNTPANGAAIKFQRDTNISTKKVDFTDGSVLTETDLDTNSDQVLFAQQEITDKLSGIEENATADQTNAEIKTAYEANSDTNAFTDALQTKLNNIESNATADQTNAEIRAAVEAASDSNVFTDNDHTKLNNIEDNATADQTVSEIKSLIASSPLSGTHLATDSVTTEKIVDDAVTNAKIANNSVQNAQIQDAAVTTTKIADANVTTAKIADNAIVTAKISDNAVTTTKIPDNNITTAKINNDAITRDKIADGEILSAALAANSVTTDKIADSELTTLAGMQSGTASKLADSTALTSDIADLNQIDGLTKQTTISDSDASFPTSGAVVDYVAAQLAPIGGLEVIATDAAFPNTQPQAGVVISIADAGGLVVDANGTSTTARTVGGSTVTINNFASNFNSSTVDAGVAIMVSSTGSGQVYNYHKATLKEADLLSLSNDINDFAARYRVTTGEPTSNNDEGDLIYDKNADKMKVFDSTTNAFKEVTSVGDYKFLFLCPAGGSGSPTINGSIATYDLREGGTSGAAASVTSAAQLIVSINGVIQKPNTGTSAPSEGFAMVDSNTIIFGSNLPTGAEVFIIQIGSATTLNVPADNSVATAKIQNQGVTTAKIADDAVNGSKIADNSIDSEHYADGSIDTAHIADDAVNAAKIADGAIDNSAKIGGNIINNTHMADNAIGTNEIADNAVTTAKIANNAITTDKVTDDSVTQAKLNFPVANRNLIINGAMKVAQRGTSSTTNGYGSVDRFFINYSGLDEIPTQEQVDVSSGTTPYTLGFRKAFKMTNGNQTSGAGSSDRLLVAQRFEGQDIVQSGWNYLSSSSNITISFWVKSSVAQNFYFRLQTSENNSPYNYPMETGALTANTWTKITKTVPGNSNLQISNNNTEGLKIEWMMFRGTANTDSSVSLNAWAVYSGSARTPDHTSTWYTTNDATFELTGVQIEVGSVATDFEHRSFGQELLLCQRYCYITTGGGAGVGVGGGSNAVHRCQMNLPVTMRAAPSVSMQGSTIYTYDGANSAYFNGFAAVHSTNQAIDWETSDSERTAGSVTAYRPVIAYINSSSGGVICSAEL